MFGAFFSDVTSLGFVLVPGLVILAVRAMRPKPGLELQIAVPAERIQRMLAGVARAQRAPLPARTPIFDAMAREVEPATGATLAVAIDMNASAKGDFSALSWKITTAHTDSATLIPCRSVRSAKRGRAPDET
jgi:hypothetical protein